MKLSVYFRFIAFSGITLFAFGFKPTPMNAQNIGSTPALKTEEHLQKILQELSLEEKINLLTYQNEGVARLQIAPYNWWNEGLHGVARAGKATVFPQAIGMAASFNPILLETVADAISTEARAKYNLAKSKQPGMPYSGLSFWSPNINLYRDPRWGRGQETYGEDPFLTAQMGIAYVRGMQGNNPNRLKTAACAKHFAVHSGPEKQRHSFNALVDEKDLRETYLYAFKKLVGARVEAVMCAYNRINGEACCTGNFMLNQILRKEFGFSGQLVTDCWALEDIRSGHQVEKDGAVIAALAIKAGVNLECGSMLKSDLKAAYDRKLVTMADLDQALMGNLRTQMRLGFFDAPTADPYLNYGVDSISNSYHRMLARQMATESMVLLSNKGVLPLDTQTIRSVMILGPNAASEEVLLGNYYGLSTQPVSFLSGMVNAIGNHARIEYDPGCNYYDTLHFGGLWAASNTEVSILVIGNSASYEGEDGDAFLSPSGGDRENLQLPKAHLAYLKAFRKSNPNKKLIVVLTGGSCFDLTEVEPLADAIILAWYPGEQGGNALADILLGKISPSGRLPISYYQSLDAFPEYSSYQMKDRTYRYHSSKIKYPFGFGLSYGNFSYRWVQKPSFQNQQIQFSIRVKNSANIQAAEVAQVYISYPETDRMPRKELKAFQKKTIQANDSLQLDFVIPLEELAKWDLKENRWKIFPGKYQIKIGSSSDDTKLEAELKLKEKPIK